MEIGQAILYSPCKVFSLTPLMWGTDCTGFKQWVNLYHSRSYSPLLWWTVRWNVQKLALSLPNLMLFSPETPTPVYEGPITLWMSHKLIRTLKCELYCNCLLVVSLYGYCLLNDLCILIIALWFHKIREQTILLRRGDCAWCCFVTWCQGLCHVL